jgi:hypothetical protein
MTDPPACVPEPLGVAAPNSLVNSTSSELSKQVMSWRGCAVGVAPGRPQSWTMPGMRLMLLTGYDALPARTVTDASTFAMSA